MTTSIGLADEALRLDTVNATLGHVVDNKSVLDMPLNTRNTLDLVLLAPGVTGDGGYTGTNFVSNGTRNSQSDVLIDGVTWAVQEQNGIVADVKFRPAVEIVREFEVQMQGQSVGTAAAYAIARSLTPRQAADPAGSHIAHIQQQLLREDVHVLGVSNADPADVARDAKATATREAVPSFGEPLAEKLQNLDKPLGQVSVTHNRTHSMAFFLANRGTAAADLGMELYEMERIWDRAPGKRVAATKSAVPPPFRGWLTGDRAARKTPSKPYRAVLLRAPGVSWAEASVQPPALPPSSCTRLPAAASRATAICPAFRFRKWISRLTATGRSRRRSRAIRVTPTPKPFGAANVNNGVAWPAGMPNLWISDPGLPQSVELDFGTARESDTVLVAFDTSLNTESSQAPAFWKAPTCARDWRLYAKVDGAWQRIHEETGNYQRRRVARFTARRATGLKLKILATQGDHSARVYEIRAYRDGGNPA